MGAAAHSESGVPGPGATGASARIHLRRSRDRRRLEWGIVLLALVARLWFQWAIVGMGTPPRDDASQFDTIARSVATGGPYAAGDGSRSHRAPAYSFLLAAVYAVFGPSWPAGRVAQALIGAATCWLAFELGARLFSERVGALAALGYSLFPPAIFWCGYLLSEPLCSLVSLAAIAALVRTPMSFRWAAAWGALAAAATLTRPNMALLLPLGVAWILKVGPGRLGRVAISLAAFGLVLLPWTIRNYVVHRRIVPVTTMGGVVLWEGNNPYVLGDPGMRGRSAHAPDLPEARVVRGLSEADADGRYFELALRFMRDHAREMPGLMLRKLLRLWNPFPELPDPLQRAIGFLSVVVMSAFFLWGILAACLRRQGGVIPLLIPVVVVSLTGVIYWADARIRSPAEPAVLLVGAYGADALWRKRTRHRPPRVESALGV